MPTIKFPIATITEDTTFSGDVSLGAGGEYFVKINARDEGSLMLLNSVGSPDSHNLWVDKKVCQIIDPTHSKHMVILGVDKHGHLFVKSNPDGLRVLLLDRVMDSCGGQFGYGIHTDKDVVVYTEKGKANILHRGKGVTLEIHYHK